MTRQRELHPPSRSEPDMAILGVISLVLAMVTLLLALSYLLSPLAYLVGAVALPAGLISRGHQRSDALGTVAVVMTVVAFLVATVMIATGLT